MSMRKREEIQEMLRRGVGLPLLAISLCGGLFADPTPPKKVAASMWPEQLASAARTSDESVDISGTALAGLAEEYGLQAARKAEYAAGKVHFSLASYRFRDTTGALAGYYLLCPDKSKASNVAPVAVVTASGGTLILGNYVIQFTGLQPASREVSAIFAALPRVDQSPLPPLRDYFPGKDLVRGSERYVLGPASLQKFEPRISPSTAAFHLGAEAQIARYRAKGGEMEMAIFSYPTPQIARQRLADFERLPGVVAKRAGPFVAMVLAPPNADDAERLLAAVRYEPAVTWDQRVLKKADFDAGSMLSGIVLLAAVVGGASILVGIFFGGLRVLLARFGIQTADGSLTSLDLSGK